jgi:hypothetical protein
MDRPIVSFNQINADALAVQRQIDPELLLANDEPQDSPVQRPVLASIAFAPEAHKRKRDGQTVRVAVLPDHHRPNTGRQGYAELPGSDLPLEALLRQSHAATRLLFRSDASTR